MSMQLVILVKHLQKALYTIKSIHIIRLYLACDADVSAVYNCSTSLHDAVKYNRSLEVIELLLANRANVIATDCDDKTLFELAIKCKKNREIIEFLQKVVLKLLLTNLIICLSIVLVLQQ